MPDLAQALYLAEIAFSICPPRAAMAVARDVADHGFSGIYVDANAVSPATVRDIGAALAASGARLIDGGIVGAAPTATSGTRLYLSGDNASSVAALFQGSPLGTVVLDAPVGAASALKVCYAAWTKGAMALLADIRSLAHVEGVETALLAEWALSRPNVVKQSEQVTGSARKAWRWIGEMEEITASIEAAGLPGDFHRGAAEIYRRLAGFKDVATPPVMQDVIAALKGRLR